MLNQAGVETPTKYVKLTITLISQLSADSFSWNIVEHLQVLGEALK